MNGEDISFFLQDKDKFGSVLAIDQIQQVQPGKVYVLNSNPSYKKGRHWIVLDMTSEPYFFDSFGNSPTFYNLPPCKYSKKIIQDKKSDVCGIYCIYYITMGRRALDRFGENTKKNDKYLLQWFIKKYK
jgi:hypothetical protein